MFTSPFSDPKFSAQNINQFIIKIAHYKMFFIVHVAQVVILLIVSPSSAIQRILSPHLHL